MNKNKITIILPAKDIPIGSDVKKKNGEKIYTLVNEIKIYKTALGLSPDVIKSDEGILFLESSGSISAVPENLELAWTTDIQTLQNFLYKLQH